MKEIGVGRFCVLYFGMIWVISFLWFFIFDWLGIHIAFSIPFIVIHLESFLYYGLYKQIQKLKRK